MLLFQVFKVTFINIYMLHALFFSSFKDPYASQLKEKVIKRIIIKVKREGYRYIYLKKEEETQISKHATLLPKIKFVHACQHLHSMLTMTQYSMPFDHLILLLFFHLNYNYIYSRMIIYILINYYFSSSFNLISCF